MSLDRDRSDPVSDLPQQKLYLLRHGETEWNVIKRLQGRTDIPINERGRTQAKRHGEALAKLLCGVFACYVDDLPSKLADWHFVSSPLCRCCETMEIVRSELGMDRTSYDVSDQIAEIGFGDWEGKSWDELRLETPELIEARFQNPWDVVAPNGESHSEMQARVLSWFEKLPSKTIAVTHSGPLRIVQGHLTKLEPAEIPHLHAPQDQFMDVCAESGASSMNGFVWV